MSEIFYFSGTGNSLHVAKELKNRIPNTTLIPIVGALRKNKLTSTAETVGIVFPIHGHTFPWVVKMFLKKADFKSSSYIFALSTRECADKVFSKIEKLLGRKDHQLNASFFVNTPENFIPIFSVPSEDEVKRLENALQSKLDKIQNIIRNKKRYHENTGILVSFLANTVLRISSFVLRKINYFGLPKAYYTNDECNGCGTCEKVCLTNKIKLVDNKPIWKEKFPCTFCFACISYCPSNSIQVKRMRTTVKGRYHHPEISAKDISRQKLINI
jgi:ferredoxin